MLFILMSPVSGAAMFVPAAVLAGAGRGAVRGDQHQAHPHQHGGQGPPHHLHTAGPGHSPHTGLGEQGKGVIKLHSFISTQCPLLHHQMIAS